MTLIVRRRALLSFTIFVVVGVLAVAAYDYRAISATQTGLLTVKVAAERVLFLSILLAAAVIAGGTALVVKSIRFSAILDKLVSMNKMSGFSPERSLERLGEVGTKINELYRQTADLSAKKTRKIGGLSALVEFMMSISDKTCMVTDLNGRVLYASRAFLERIGQTRESMLNRTLAELLPDSEVAEGLRSARRSRDAVSVDVASDSLVLNPIYGSDGEAHYLVAEIPRAVADGIKASVSPKPRPAPQATVRSRFFPMLPKLFSRKGKG